MDLTNTVVVGLDGSEHAQSAAEWAATWAQERGQRLLLIAVHGTVASERRATNAAWHWPDPTERRQQVDEVLDRASDELAATHPGLTVETLVLTADPVTALVRASHEAALVVIGTRRLGGLTGKVLGSVADATVARAEGPIAVIPLYYKSRPGPVVLGFDLASPPMNAARFAFEAARESGRPLMIATVEDPVRPLELVAPVHPDEDEIADELAHREDQVEHALAGLHAEYADVPLEITVVPGLTARSLVALGADAELLVVGTRGRSEWLGWLFGSVSRSVLRETTGPAVVIPEDH
ncbi:MAG: universal stress protein [Propionibacteriaceae bacterium]|nr:universal stress protein [Propionibacteriaceae bacterium]